MKRVWPIATLVVVLGLAIGAILSQRAPASQEIIWLSPVQFQSLVGSRPSSRIREMALRLFALIRPRSLSPKAYYTLKFELFAVPAALPDPLITSSGAATGGNGLQARIISADQLKVFRRIGRIMAGSTELEVDPIMSFGERVFTVRGGSMYTPSGTATPNGLRFEVAGERVSGSWRQIIHATTTEANETTPGSRPVIRTNLDSLGR